MRRSTLTTAGAAALMVLAGCGDGNSSLTANPYIIDKSTQSAGSPQHNDTGLDPGVRPLHGKAVLFAPESLGSLGNDRVIEGTVVKEQHPAAAGEIDSFSAVRTITVRVDKTLHGTQIPEDVVTISNGMYEWAEPGAADPARAHRYTEFGEPWLKVGEKALLVLRPVPDPSAISSRVPAEFISYGPGGTFRIVDGRIDPSPRSSVSLRAAPELTEQLVGSTTREVDQLIDN